jgi:hypothetical protein
MKPEAGRESALPHSPMEDLSMTSFKWMPTAPGPDGRPCEYQIAGHTGKIGVRRYTGNRPLRPYYLAGPNVPEEFGGCYRLLADAKKDAETVLRGILNETESTDEDEQPCLL